MAPASSGSDLIAQGCILDIGILQSSPGDSNMHPRVRTSLWIPGTTFSWRIWLPEENRIPTLEEPSNCFAISHLLPLREFCLSSLKEN